MEIFPILFCFNGNFSYFCVVIKQEQPMKYKEFHNRIKANGWKFSHAEGSHYFYLKDGKLSQPIPYHGAKEMPEFMRRRIAREMNIK